MIEVVCGLFVRAGELLIVRRKPGGRHGGSWEFPGGKIEPGESAPQALVRELAEELGVAVQAGRQVGECADGFIRLRGYLIREWRGDIVLNEHVAMQWSTPERLHEMSLPPTDLGLLRCVASAGVLT